MCCRSLREYSLLLLIACSKTLFILFSQNFEFDKILIHISYKKILFYFYCQLIIIYVI